MNNNCRSSFLSLVSISIFLAVIFVGLATRTSAQSNAHPATVNRLAHLNDFAKRAGANFEGRLSMGGATMFHLARIRSGLHMEDAAQTPAAHSAMAASKARFNAQSAPCSPPRRILTASSHGPVPVSDASLDYVFSRFSGFTQSESSTAWCGDNIVVGFNDSGADLRSFVDQVGGRSFSSVGVSHNGREKLRRTSLFESWPEPCRLRGGRSSPRLLQPTTLCVFFPIQPQHFR